MIPVTKLRVIYLIASLKYILSFSVFPGWVNIPINISADTLTLAKMTLFELRMGKTFFHLKIQSFQYRLTACWWNAIEKHEEELKHRLTFPMIGVLAPYLIQTRACLWILIMCLKFVAFQRIYNENLWHVLIKEQKTQAFSRVCLSSVKEGLCWIFSPCCFLHFFSHTCRAEITRGSSSL